MTHSDSYRVADNCRRGLSEGERRLRAGLSPHGQAAAGAALAKGYEKGGSRSFANRPVRWRRPWQWNVKLADEVKIDVCLSSELPSLLTDIKITAF